MVDTAADVRTWLGRPRFFFEAPDRTSVPGVSTGLAVTGVGGDVLFVEVTSMPGEPGLTLTGQLGDVMKESATIAVSYVRSHAQALGIDPAAFDGRRFHVHVPAGAVPKDGPSAGVTRGFRDVHGFRAALGGPLLSTTFSAPFSPPTGPPAKRPPPCPPDRAVLRL